MRLTFKKQRNMRSPQKDKIASIDSKTSLAKTSQGDRPESDARPRLEHQPSLGGWEGWSHLSHLHLPGSCLCLQVKR